MSGFLLMVAAVSICFGLDDWYLVRNGVTGDAQRTFCIPLYALLAVVSVIVGQAIWAMIFGIMLGVEMVPSDHRDKEGGSWV